MIVGPVNADGMLTRPTLENYRENFHKQAAEWIKGNPIHNPLIIGAEDSIEDQVKQAALPATHQGECCPDFSCCMPELFEKNEEIRRKIAGEALKEISWFSYEKLKDS